MTAQLARTLSILALAAVLSAPAIAHSAPAPQAPPFTLELFNGQGLTLAELKNKAVILLFWAEW